MRSLLALASVMLLVVPLPATGQTTPGPLLDDGSADVQIVVATLPPQAAPSQHYQALDLLGLTIVESDDSFTFTLSVAGLDKAPEVPLADDTVYYITFRHNDQDYRIVMDRYLGGDQSYYWAYLLKYDPDGNMNYQRGLGLTPDATAGTLQTTLMREDLVDRNGAAPFPGRSFAGFWVESHLSMSQERWLSIDDIEPTSNVDATDRMPASDVSEKVFAIQRGVEQSGHAQLRSDDPVRASNGEASTFVFNITGINTGLEEEVFAMSAIGVPEGWAVSMPAQTVRIAGESEMTLPVIVSTPFAHLHGVLKKFRVELQSQADPGSVGRIDIGIRYFAVAQPAGHHNTVYMHSQSWGSDSPLAPAIELAFAGNSGYAYFNTLQTDPEDAGIPITANFWGYGCFDDACTPASQWRSWVYLQPSLEMGLDFDLAGTVDIQVPIVSRGPLPQTTVSGYLVHEMYDEAKDEWHQTTLAALEPSDLRDLNANTPEIFSWSVKPTAESDFLPYAKRAYMGLVLNITSLKPTLFTGAEAPMLAPGGVMKLPLFEYHDPVSDALRSIGAVRLEPLGERERAVNPGKVAVFAVRLVNDLDSAADFALDVSGVHDDWSRLLGPTQLHVAARSSVEIRLAIQVPDNAADRDAADIVLKAEDPQNPQIQTLVRLRANVDAVKDQRDDTQQLEEYRTEEPKSTPPLSLPIVAVAILAFVAFGRRKFGGQA